MKTDKEIIEKTLAFLVTDFNFEFEYRTINGNEEFYSYKNRYGSINMEACLYMKKYNLTEEEKAIVNKFCKYSIPFIFKSGEYCGYMQYFEWVNFEICSALLKGERIDEENYQMIMSQGVDIIKEKLDNYALEFFNLYLLVENIAKKYY